MLLSLTATNAPTTITTTIAGEAFKIHSARTSVSHAFKPLAFGQTPVDSSALINAASSLSEVVAKIGAGA